MLKKICLVLAIVATTTSVQAQDDWSSPELKVLYSEAEKAMGNRDYDKAINVYFQAIRLQPGNLVLRRDLAYAYYLSGKYQDGITILEEIRKSGNADPETYQLLSALENANGDKRKSLRLIDEGLRKFPSSGVLLFSKGNSLLANDKKKNDALKYFVKGIENDGLYSNNYLAAAKILLERDEPIWAMIYSEIFVNLEPQSNKSVEGRRTLLEAYSRMFSAQAAGSLPSFANSNSKRKSDFGKAVTGIYLGNYLSVASGMTIDNLTMLRTRFLLDWMAKYSVEDHSLFRFHDMLIRNGHFEAYNQFLLGAITGSSTFSSWMQKNGDLMKNMNSFVSRNAYQPLNTDPQFQ